MNIKIPTTCPSCDSTLIRVNGQLFCKSLNCAAQNDKKLEKYCKALKIKGLGPASLTKLNLDSISALYDLTEVQCTDALGTANGIKVYTEIRKSLKTSVEMLLPAFSIPLVGKTAAAKLQQVIGNVKDITSTTCKDAGLGAKVTENLLDWFSTSYIDLGYVFSNAEIVPVVEATLGTVCITGKLNNGLSRSEATGLLQQRGYRVRGSVTSMTDYLLCEDGSTSSKLTKAQTLGITITTLQELL